MEYKNFWVWDQECKRCISSRIIEDFDIVESGVEETNWKVYANLINKDHVVISEHKERFRAKQKINDIIAGAGI